MLRTNQKSEKIFQIFGVVGLIWALTTGTVQCNTELCVNQAEGVSNKRITLMMEGGSQRYLP